MEASASTREDAPVEGRLGGGVDYLRDDRGTTRCCLGFPLLFFGGVLAIYAGIGYAVYLTVAAIA